MDNENVNMITEATQLQTGLEPPSALDDQTLADQTVDYSELIDESAFLGDYPIGTILEGITEQFNDYIDMEDKTNYVDIFYNQLHASYEAVNSDDGEEHPEEFIEVLDKIQQRFIDAMKAHFQLRLTLTLNDIESEEFDSDRIEYVIRRLYEFFILGAKNNFKVVIATDINSKIKTIIEDDKEYFDTLQEMLDNYSPIITVIGPMEFLRIRNDKEIIELFESNRVVGNFLRKYSPKLYQNEEFEVELINYITMTQQVTEEILNPVE
jgi:hypothetical protein